MKLRWWLIALAAATAGVVFLLHRTPVRNRMLHFVDEETGQKNFDAFPPEIPGAEFEGIDFFS